VRVRIWGTDREVRAVATAARGEILTDRSKAASSSYVSASRFDCGAKVALDLLAMAPSDRRAVKSLVEFEPARNYLRFLRYDRVVFVSGFTSEADGLQNQARQVLSDLNEALKAAGSGVERIVRAAVFMDRNQNIATAKSILSTAGTPGSDVFEFELVDGFAREKGLLEVEITALAEDKA
jgi:enamine deaminase RidA (YjgF/YER057c/UK114 family)